ncbi:MAG: 3'-5' exonuclease domain-containing protein 2, partial [Prevotellaceae bacterium]|nr:3'-5' exonuclease domain-containing protein 2 [Prevotellaceae bacterium]
MTKILTDQVDKATISKMPRDSFGGRIVVVQKEAEVDEAVNYLLGQKVLGFDTETRPSFHKGHMNQVALLQVASHDMCFLFRLNKLGLPDGLLRLLTENTVLKVGLSWHDDLHSLHRLKAFQCAPFVELQDYA